MTAAEAIAELIRLHTKLFVASQKSRFDKIDAEMRELERLLAEATAPEPPPLHPEAQ